jgi:hypothetical protein
MRALIARIKRETGFDFVRTEITGGLRQDAKVSHVFTPKNVKPNLSYFSKVRATASKLQGMGFPASIEFSGQQTSAGSFLIATHHVPWTKLPGV